MMDILLVYYVANWEVASAMRSPFRTCNLVVCLVMAARVLTTAKLS